MPLGQDLRILTKSSNTRFFRGVGTLYQAMSLGMKALKFSDATSSLDEIQQEEKSKGKAGKEVPKGMLAANLIFSLAMFIFMYKFIPLYLTTWAEGHLSGAPAEPHPVQSQPMA